MDDAQLKSMVHTAAREAALETLQALGIDASNPLASQLQFARLRELNKLLDDDDLHKDMLFVRRLRVNADRVVEVSLKTVVTSLVTVVLGILALGTKDWWIAHIKG